MNSITDVQQKKRSSSNESHKLRFTTHFESAIAPGVTLPADRIQTTHENRPLFLRYDLDAVKYAMTKSVLATRAQNMWRYRELLPIGNAITPVTMGKTMSPIIECQNLASQFGIKNLWIKDESQLPTCSFKSRGLSLAVTMARHFGIKRIAMSSNGNAGGAMAMYAARAGLESVVFMPEDAMPVNLRECFYSGAKLFVTNGFIDDNSKLIGEGHNQGLWFDISTMKEPYRLEGKKTMGLELAEQFKWQLPSVILYPTGGGTALIAMWKAFKELREMGYLTSETMPRLIACQSTGCMPIYTAYQNNKRFAKRHENAATIATGIRVPLALGDFMILDAIRESNGSVLAVNESEIVRFQRQTALAEGMMICPETATCIGALDQLTESGLISAEDKIVVFNTAAGQKYFGGQHMPFPKIDITKPIQWDLFESQYLDNYAGCTI